MNAIQVKSYLFPDNSKISINNINQADEIRRFSLNFSANGLYKSLIEKIQSAYGSLLPKADEIKTYWQDDENELVGFSSDAEMQFAIDVQAAMRLSRPYELNHVNPLFKVYIARKSVEVRHGFRPPFMPEHQGPQLHLGVICDGCDGPIVGIRYKCSSCADYDLCEACESKGVHKDQGHLFNKIETPRRCPFVGQRPPRPFMHCHRQRNRERPAGPVPAAHSNPLEQTLNDFIPHLASSIPIVSDPEQLKTVGEYLKTFLDPFGIDVDYYIDTINSNKPQPKAEEKEKPKETPSTPSPNPHAASSATPSDQNDKTFKRADSINSTMNVDVVTIKPSTSSASIPTAPLQPDSPFETLKKFLEKKEEQEVTPKPTETVPDRKQPTNEVVEDNGFNLIDIEKELKIIRAIEQLKTMGYSDDGGWLTRLVTAKDGNINSVLDAISPFGNK